ncbi:MAG: peptidylprolyl isomerase [Desulfuromonadales bacterium]|nr:peptidylprolyl isomerase [Desulfuromonadales bacterium]
MMKHLLVVLSLLLMLATPLLAAETVVIETSQGNITVELDAAKAPLSVANFLTYAEAGHYEGTIFHRVIKGFMIQGGNFTADMTPKPTREPIKNEAANGLRNLRGTIAMARTSVVDSATSQFFINLVDNAFLDHKDESMRGFGYAVFGRVIDGMDVVDRIGATRTHTFKRFQDVPVEPVVITGVRRLAGQ